MSRLTSLGLFWKFLLVLIPIFVALAGIGFWVLLHFDVRNTGEELSARIGNQAARAATALSRHEALGNAALARDLLAPLASDRAVVCAELRTTDDGLIIAAAPPQLGCSHDPPGHEFSLEVGGAMEALLLVRFNDEEIVRNVRIRRNSMLSVIVLAFLIAVASASIGFRAIVGRRLRQLHTAFRRITSTGERVPLKTEGEDELSEIMVAFNEMIEREAKREQDLQSSNQALEASGGELERLNRELEDRINAREGEARFRDFAASASDWYWEMDAALRFSYFSARFTEVTGVPDTALLGQSREETGIPNVDPEIWERHLDDLANHRPFRNFAHPRVKPSGEVVWLSINGTPVFSDGKAFKGYRGTGSDITKLTHAQKALEESETQHSLAAQTASLGHWRFDEVANEYLSISEGLAHIFGYTVEEFLARYRTHDEDMELVHPDDRTMVQRAYEMSPGAEVDYRIVRRDGVMRYVREISNHTLDETGNSIESVGTLQDITELKEAQLQAEQASRAKSEFLSRMSHELRTPMNAVLGFAQLLGVDPSKQLNEKQQGFVEHILNGGQHLLTLIDEVLDIVKVESGRMQLFMEGVNPASVVRECIELTRSLSEASDIEIENRLSAESRLNVWADGTRLKQVLLNLLSNAVKYNRPGGRVVVQCKAVDGDTVRIEVSDTGPGVSSERLDDLFEPFHRLDAEQRGIEGTGVGLTITKRLVDAMDGSIGVESTVGEGSTFWVEFARAPERIPEEPGDSDAGVREVLTAEHRRIILYIEDNPANLALMREIVKQRFDVGLLDAPSAELGLELAVAHRPDVILMDLNLPGIDGFDALQVLKSHQATRNIPVIAVSADAMTTQIEKGREAGFDDYLSKPFQLDELTRVLERSLKTVRPD